MPASKDVICFVRKDHPSGVEPNLATAQKICKENGYDGVLELRHQEDAIFMAKIMYCAWDLIIDAQPGTKKVDINKHSKTILVYLSLNDLIF